MNWYTFLKYAQNWQAYVKSLGVTDDDVQVLESIDNEKTRNIVINELRKKPGTAARQILENIKPKSEVEHTPWELKMANRFPSGELSKWILVQLRRLRKSPKEVMLKERGVRGPGELVQEFDYNPIHDPTFTFRPEINTILRHYRQEIIDWYNAEHPQMASYTLLQATQATHEWHERISSETDATSFEEGEKNIVYGPQWNNPEWNGWTVRRILTANDVQYEGYVMEHCVGSYDCDVVDEKTKIYSLRDPGNKPHVTMEAEVESWEFKQIHGKSNSEPKREYKKMIGEWMKTLKDVSIGTSDDFDYSSLEYEERENIPDALHNIVFKTDDYGIDTKLNYFNFDVASSSVIHALTGSSFDNAIAKIRAGTHRGRRDAIEAAEHVADTLVMATVEKDRSMIDYFFEEIEISRRKGGSSVDAFHSVRPSLRDFETNRLIGFIERSFEDLDDQVYEAADLAVFSLDMALSNEEIEELEPEELERRKKEVFDEVQREIRGEYVSGDIKYALADALHDTLSWYLKKKPLPELPLYWEVWYGRAFLDYAGRPKFTYYQEDPQKTELLSQNKAG